MMLLLKYTLMYTMVLMLVALGGMFSEHSGIINIALEGIMVIGGLVGVLLIRILPPDIPAWALVTISILGAAISGAVYAALLAFASVNLKADQTIGGTALNLLATAIALVIAKRFNGSQSGKVDYNNAAFSFNIGPLTVNVFLFIGLVLLVISFIVLLDWRPDLWLLGWYRRLCLYRPLSFLLELRGWCGRHGLPGFGGHDLWTVEAPQYCWCSPVLCDIQGTGKYCGLLFPGLPALAQGGLQHDALYCIHGHSGLHLQEVQSAKGRGHPLRQGRKISDFAAAGFGTPRHK